MGFSVSDRRARVCARIASSLSTSHRDRSRTMDESDEDIDPLVGPVADLMAEHQLASTGKSEPSMTEIEPMKTIELLPTKSFVWDYLSGFNLRLLLQALFQYPLDILWYRYMKRMFPHNEQEVCLIQQPVSRSLKKLCLLSFVS
jgi:hypothetical protein